MVEQGEFRKRGTCYEEARKEWRREGSEDDHGESENEEELEEH